MGFSGNLTGFFYQRFSTSSQQWEWWSGIEDHVKLNKKQLINGQYIHEPAFIPIEPDADRLSHPLPNFFRKGTNKSNDVVEVIDSCNGLLLCCNYTGKNFKSYFVCNPLTEERVALPCPASKRSNLVYFGLLADTTSAGYFQYKVVCVFSPKRDDSCSILLVLSSETGKWKEFEERLPALCNESMMGSKVVINSRPFWDCVEGHILVCHLNKNCYELIESPRAPLGRSLWKSKDKLFCYCQGFDDEFPVWSMCVNDDEKEVLEWKLEGCSEEFEMLSEDVSNEFGSWLTTLKGPKPRVEFKIIGVKPESNEIYLWKPDVVIRYDFTERELEILWGHGFGRAPLAARILPYVHSFAPIQIAKMEEEEAKTYVDVERNNTTK
uniref:F-box protein At3g26010-like beta-propeller domain-containing protein n=1 Tax=Fagus sylvatica TaxID=28930 RepID=A0A2N9HVQ0_FAGSY